jgi:hypothetical protein
MLRLSDENLRTLQTAAGPRRRATRGRQRHHLLHVIPGMTVGR